MEEISRGCASTGVIMSVNNSLYCDPVLQVRHRGAEEGVPRALRPRREARLLRPHRARGRQRRRRAEDHRRAQKGDEYVINGSKNWITNGPKADAIVLFTMTDQGRGQQGHHRLPRAHQHARASPAPSRTRSWASTPRTRCTIFFENMRVPAKNLLGKEGEGFKVAMSTLDGGRIGIAVAGARHRARRLRGGASRYSKERKTFGKPIARPPGHPVHARRHGHRARRGAAAHARARR